MRMSRLESDSSCAVRRLSKRTHFAQHVDAHLCVVVARIQQHFEDRARSILLQQLRTLLEYLFRPFVQYLAVRLMQPREVSIMLNDRVTHTHPMRSEICVRQVIMAFIHCFVLSEMKQAKSTDTITC